MGMHARGENRDYIPKRQKGVADNTCDLKEGCAFKATATKRTPHYRKVNDYQGGESRMGPSMDEMMEGWPSDF